MILFDEKTRGTLELVAGPDGEVKLEYVCDDCYYSFSVKVPPETIASMLVLETTCEMCKGDGGRDWWEPCQCRGIGTIPTPLGERVVELISSRFRSMLRSATNC